MPSNFNPESSSSLGWHIINTLVKEDLNGKIILTSGEKGTEIRIEAKENAKQQ